MGVTGSVSFEERVRDAHPDAACAERVATLMVNVGLRCDLECAHCHHACSPSREELMAAETMEHVIEFARALDPDLVDVTGGAPELHPGIEGFLDALARAGLRVRIRSNLTALAGPARGLPPLLASLGVGVLASLPWTGRSAPGRSEEHWETCVGVLARLNALGFAGADGPGLDIACNTDEPQRCGERAEVERETRRVLEREGVVFDRLLLLTDMPLGRRAEALSPEALLRYVERLADRFEPDTLPHLACRHGIEVAWDGTLWDCDFNLAADVRPAAGFRTLDEADPDTLATRPLSFGRHCWACTALAGSG